VFFFSHKEIDPPDDITSECFCRSTREATRYLPTTRKTTRYALF
jgi:hypothetical protein